MGHIETGARLRFAEARLAALIACVAMAFALLAGAAFPVQALAAQDASLTLQVMHVTQGQTINISGATATAYKVASLDDNINTYELLDAFSSLNVNFNDGLDAETMNSLAVKAANLVKTASAEGKSVVSDSNGIASFGTLDYGVYLVVQTASTGVAEGYELFDPFLISVPQILDDEIVYDVNCLPKLTPKEAAEEEEEEEEEEEAKPTPTPTPSPTPQQQQQTNTNTSKSNATPKTGDPFDPSLALGCLVVSGIIVLVAARARNRRDS